MPRIRPERETEKFRMVSSSTRDLNENNDCAVKAVAILCDVPYAKALAELTRLGRRQGHGTKMWMTFAAIEKFGFKHHHTPSVYFITVYPGVHKGLKGITTHHPSRFNRVWADGHKYLLVTREHVAAVIDGRCHDWSTNRALRVTSVYRIVKHEVAK